MPIMTTTFTWMFVIYLDSSREMGRWGQSQIWATIPQRDNDNINTKTKHTS